MSRNKKEFSNFKVDVAKRLKQFRKTLGMTQDEFSRALGVSKPAYVRYESGDRFPPIKMLQILYRVFKMNINWLFDGRRDMFATGESSENEGGYPLQFSDLGEDKEYVDMIKLMRDIPQIEQIILAKFIELKTLFKEEIKKKLLVQKDK